MDDENPDRGFIQAPRIFGIVVGVLFLPLALLFAIVGVGLLESVWKGAGLAVLSGGLGSLWAAWFTLTVCWRLISGRPRRDGGLLSPWSLRAAAWLLVAMPVVALLIGSLKLTEGTVWLRLLQIAGYLLAARALYRLAASREAGRDGPGPD